MTTFIKMAIHFIFTGALIVHVLGFNPLLTYTLRYKKIHAKPNITFDYYTIDQYKDVQYINGQVRIDSKEHINNLVGVFYRCDFDGINCEYFQTWKITDSCSKLMEKNQLWSRWYNSFDPPMQCPIDKVNYKIKNATVDVSLMLIFYPPATDYQWKVVQNLYADDIYVGSYTIEAFFFGYRKRVKSILKL